MRFHKTAAASGLIAAALALAGCATVGDDMAGMDHGSGASSPSSSTTPIDANTADEMFVTMMIPHHRQAIEMSDVILGKEGVDERVSALAQRIKDAQGPEIEKMEGWLDEWGIPDVDSAPGHDMSGGMMTDEDMLALESAEGADAARLFLTAMVAHHEGAVAMAQDEVRDGRNAEVTALAQQVIDGQTAEIEEMEALLSSR